MKYMRTPKTRAEFERNFHLLCESMEQDKFHVTQEAAHSIASLEAVRRLPNGRIDFLSVNESARLQANTMANFPTDEIAEAIQKAEPVVKED